MNNYFSHDSNARDDEKILAMRIDLGWEAYGLYWALIEMLRDASDYQLRTNFKVLAFSLHTTPDLLQQIICNYGLFSFTEDNESFFSHSLSKRMEEKEVVSKKRRASAGIRWGKPSTSNANAEQDACKCNANAEQSKVNKSKVKESKDYSSPRMREGASAPGEEEKEVIYRIFFWRNMKKPGAEVIRFWEHNAQYGWKLNDTPEKRIKAAEEWVPESKGNRVSKEFLELWKAIYAKIPPNEDALKDLMLEEDTRASVNNGAIVIHAHPKLVPFLHPSNHPELAIFARGNPIRFSSP